MIDFRYHLVSIVAVFLALAIGLLIGAAALNPPLESGLTAINQRLTQFNSRLTAERDALNRQIAADQAFARADYQYLLNQLLPGQQVVVVTAPGADPGTVSGVTAALSQAGAIVTGQVSLQQPFFDTSQATEYTLDQTASQLAPAGLALGGAGSPVYGQQAAAAVLAAAITAKDGPAAMTAAERQQILAGLAQHGYLQVRSATGGATLSGAADLAVVVPPATPPATDGDPRNQILVAVTGRLQLASRGAVLAGTLSGSGPGSVIDDVSSGTAGVKLATVDDADTTIGQILVVQALRLLLQPGASPASYGVYPGTAPSPAPSSPVSPSAPVSPSSSPSRGGKHR